MYAEYWRKKLKNKPAIEFPKTLCSAVADITDDFSFAYMKEAFVATLLDLARNHATGDTSDEDGDSDDDDNDGLDKYKFWKVFKVQVKILRDEMDGGSSTSGHPTAGGCRECQSPRRSTVSRGSDISPEASAASQSAEFGKSSPQPS